jgi:hypothetical protein
MKNMRNNLRRLLECFCVSFLFVYLFSWVNHNFYFYFNLPYLKIAFLVNLIVFLFLFLFLYFLRRNLGSKKGVIFFSAFLIFLFFQLLMIANIPVLFKKVNYKSIIVLFVTCSIMISLNILFYREKSKLLVLYFFKYSLIFLPFVAWSLSTLVIDYFEVNRIIKNNKNKLLEYNAEDTNKKPRVFVFVFDELDYSFLYKKNLSELDFLKKNCFFATNAYQTVFETIDAIPSLTLGVPSKKTLQKRSTDLDIELVNGNTVSWKNSDNLFSLAKQDGISVALLGFHIPYDVIFNSKCDYIYCDRHRMSSSNSYEIFKYNFSKTVKTLFYFSFQKYIEYLSKKKCFYAPHFTLQSIFDSYENVKKRYFVFLDKTKSIIDNNHYRLCFFHWCLPHRPYFYNSKNSVFENKTHSYSDNLVLLDRTIHDIRKHMEKKKLWDSSYIIITSDHQLRTYANSLTDEEKEICSNRKKNLIPFIVKIPNNKSFLYNKPFHVCILKDIVLKMLKGQINNNEEFAEFIDENRIY